MKLISQICKGVGIRGLVLLVMLVVLMAWAIICRNVYWRWIVVAALAVALLLFIDICRILTNIYSLRKNEVGITWCQIAILIGIGLWIVAFCFAFDGKAHPRLAVGLGVLGSILTWIFQDTVKGVVAFINMRMNNMLHIDDWIQIPKYNVDGEVKRVTLTNVTIYNWDTTTSSIPTSVLHSEHLINLKNMMDGKTFGRRMFKTFIFDTSWIHNITAEESRELRQMEDVTRYMPKEEIREGMINAQLFRVYLFHWMMNHPHVSQQPRLVVRWLEQKESGLPLQVYAFITESGLSAFEWQQSQIIEHIIESQVWFGLRLYQSPSAYDVSNSNVHLTEESATYRKES